MAALSAEGTYRENWFLSAISLQGHNPRIKLMATLMLSPRSATEGGTCPMARSI